MLYSITPLVLLSLFAIQLALQVFLVTSITWKIYLTTVSITPAAVAMFICCHILYQQYLVICVYTGYEMLV